MRERDFFKKLRTGKPSEKSMALNQCGGREHFSGFWRTIALLLSSALFIVSIPSEAWAGAIPAPDGSNMHVTDLGYRPGGILTADDGSIFVKNCDNSTNGHGQVYKYDKSGKLVTEFGSGGHTAFETSNRGVGLSYASDGDIVTTFYDGYIYKFNSETGAQTAVTEVDGVPYCSVLYNDYIYVIIKSENRHILVLDNDLKTVSEADLGVEDGGSIPVEYGYYGLAIAKSTDKNGNVAERLYTTQFGKYVYGYIKSGNRWVKDSSFGSNGKLESCRNSAGGLFYNANDQKVYVCSEKDQKVYNFNPDGTNLNKVLEGAGPNNVYISDSSYAVPFFGGRAFQIFYRPSLELNKDNFHMQILNTVDVGTAAPLKIRVQNTNSSLRRSYQVTAQLLDGEGAPVNAKCTEGTLVSGSVDLSITPNSNWIAGQYQIQLLISSKVQGTSLIISETMKLDAQVPVGLYKVTFQQPMNGVLENNDAMYAKQTGEAMGSSVTKWVQPEDSYEVDGANCQVLPENSGAQVTVGTAQPHTVNGVEGTWYPLTVTNITSDIQVSVTFKMNAAALQKKKQEILAALNTIYQKYRAEDYFGDNWGKLTKIKDDCVQKIQNAVSAGEVDILFAEAQVDMSGVPNKSTDKERQQLVKDAKAAIETEFNNKYGAPGIKDTYSDDNWSKILLAKEDAIKAIEAAADENDINSAQQAGLSAMAEVPNIAQAELNTKKEESKKVLDQVSVGNDNYTPEQIGEIEAKRQELKNQIDNAAAADGFEKLTSEFNSFVKTYLTKGEKAEMAQAVTDEFNRLITANKYTAANTAALTGQKDVGIAAIQKALLKSVAEAARDAAITEMGKVTTKADEQAATLEQVKNIFDESMKVYAQETYDTENWNQIQELYNQAVSGMTELAKQDNTSESDMLAVMNKALANIKKIETKDAALKTAKDTALTQIATSYKAITDKADCYTQENLDMAYRIYADTIKKINEAADKGGLAGVVQQADADFNGIKPISITLKDITVDFGTHAYAGGSVGKQDVIISASTMEGCHSLNITGVNLSDDEAFTLNGPKSGTLAEGTENKDWSIVPKEGLIPGTYTADVTVTYDCEGKAGSSINGKVTMAVTNADQEAPAGLTVSHQKQADKNDGELRGVSRGMEYKGDTGSNYIPVPEDTDGTIHNLAPGTYLVRMAAKEYYNPSEDTACIIKEVQSNTFTVSVQPERGVGTEDGSITVSGPAGDLEYRAAGGNYQSCENEIEHLKAGIYYVRYAETDTVLAGKETKVEVECDAYEFTCNFNPHLGDVQLSDGSELPGDISKSQDMDLKVTPTDGYMVKPDGITVKSASVTKGEVNADHSFLLTVKNPTGEVTLSVTFVKTPEREALDKKKDDIKDKINQAIADEKAGYTTKLENEAAQLGDLNDQYINFVKDAATINDINKILEEFQDKLKNFHKDVMNEVKKHVGSPSEAIKGDKQEEDYSKENWKKLDDLVVKAEKLLAEAATPKDIEDIMAQITWEAKNIPTKADDEKALKKLKEDILGKLATPSEAAHNQPDAYTPESWQDIINLINAAKDKIKDAGTKTADAVNLIFENLNQDIDQVFTLDKERLAYIAKLDTAYKGYNQDDYAPEVWNVLNGYHELGTAKLENSAARADMDQLLKEYQKKMAEVKKDWELNPGVQKDPNTELVEYLIDLLPPPKNASEETLKDAEDAIQAAKEAYDNLNEKQAEQLDAGKAQKLEKLIHKLKNIKAWIEDDDNLNVKTNDIAGLLLNQMEISSSSSVEVVLKVSLKQEDESERELVTKIAPVAKIGSYLNITLEKIIDGKTEKLRELRRPMEIKFTIPKELRGYKNYKMIRIHDKVPEELDTVQNANTLKFTTNRFSTYVLTYEENPSQVHNPGSSGGSGGGGGAAGASKKRGAASIQGTWVQNDNGWWFSKADGTWPVSQWLYTGNGKWYYFNENGYMVTGWVQLNNIWYYLKENGEMAVGWIQLGNSWYYLQADGAMAVGWIQLGDSWYYLQADGAMAVGWVQLGDSWYYLQADGAMAVGWVLSDGHWYYMDETGAMRRNCWLSLSDGRYYLGTDGAMAAGTVIDGIYVNADGKAARG